MVDDKTLGMDRAIDRRDFLNGVAVKPRACWGPLAPGAVLWLRRPWRNQDMPGYYPPILNGMRGSHPGSFENAHKLRDGDFWSGEHAPRDSGETYDLVIVGGGISGLSAAHFFRARHGANARILILDNHDDFGGHAKRNEFHLGGKLHLLNGGTLEIDSPIPAYSPVADGLPETLGIDPPALAKACDRRGLSVSRPEARGVLRQGNLRGRHPGGRRARPYGGPAGSWPEFPKGTPLSPEGARRHRAHRDRQDRLHARPDLGGQEGRPVADELPRVPGQRGQGGDQALWFYQSHTHGEWGVGIDAVSALDCWGFYMPGFQGMKLDPGPAPRMSFTPAGYVNGGSYSFHFPDGNASIARLLVRDLVPAAMPGSDCKDVVTARANYAALDRPGNPVRIRLSSICVRARTVGSAPLARRRNRLRPRRRRLSGAGAGVHPRLLEHDDPLPVPGDGGGAEGGPAQTRQNAPGLHLGGAA